MTRTDEPRDRPLAAARVLSSTPGRMRLRLADAARRDQLALAAEALAGRAEVSGVEARWQTRSLVVRYEPAVAEDVWTGLGELGLERPAAPATRVAQDADPEAARVLGALARANDLVAGRTHGTDLRALVPVGLGMLAVRQLVRGEQRLADAPWYVLAWYASETFQKFYAQRGEE